MGVNAGTTFTRPTMKGGSGSEGEAEEALGSSGIGDREHGTMMRGGDSSEGKVTVQCTLMVQGPQPSSGW